jgi:hypothetical protein
LFPTDSLLVPQNTSSTALKYGVTVFNKTDITSTSSSALIVKVTSPGGLITQQIYSIN